MWKAERIRRTEWKHRTDTDATKGDGEGQNSRKEGIEGRRTDGSRQRWTEMDGECLRINST